MPAAVAPQLTILTSWPQDRSAGSGTATFLEGFRAGLAQLGWTSQLAAPGPLPAPSDYAALVAARHEANARWAVQTDWPAGLPLLGLDFDGYLLPAAVRDGRQVVASPRGLFAELAPTEPELRAVLEQQASWERKNLEQADWCFVASRYAKQEVMWHYGVPPERIAVLPNGPHPGYLAALAQAAPLITEQPYILAVAKCYPRKQMPLLIRAYAQAVQQGLQADLRLIGDGFEFPLVQQLVRQLQLGDRVHLPGLITDWPTLASHYRGCLFLCHPSIQETFGNTVLEALLAGKAVIAADAGSLPEVAGPAGMYVPPGDEESLGEALLMAAELLAHYPGAELEIAERAFQQAALFTWEASAAGFVACLEAMAQQRRLPASVM